MNHTHNNVALLLLLFERQQQPKKKTDKIIFKLKKKVLQCDKWIYNCFVFYVP